ncbi:Lrp/AsnC family transcriptional regulator [Streptomyces sp. CA-249302]|uniref:Lrp/AsnC family transcriptional regulator n=1 Tax=Streptomyces sp. CA-249302 TaxID=3240058 RepID=UPI003D8FC93C
MGAEAAASKEPRHPRAAANETSVAFDAVDRQILEHLQTDGRIKLSELGRRVRLSPAAVTERVRPRTLELIARPEITEVHHMVGEDCWILKVAVRDTVHLEEVLEAVAALGRTTTSIVLTSPVERKPLLP